VTSLCHSNVVLPPVLAQEQPFFTLEQACQVLATYRYIDLEFHRLPFLLSFKRRRKILRTTLVLAR
jgi:hypothetical protein